MEKIERLNEKICCFNSQYLKFIAVIAMTIDHVGAVLLPQYLFLRMIGRIAFPIYCFVLVNGFYKTRNEWNYFYRLAGFGFVSEIIFDMTFYGKIFYFGHQNVFFTLAIGMLMLICIDKIRGIEFGKNRMLNGCLETIILIFACGIAFYLNTDYSFGGIIMIYCFYTLVNHKLIQAFFQYYINVEIYGGLQVYALFALVPIYLYNGERGKDFFKYEKWLFYIYYPAHLIVIWLIHNCIKL